MSFATPSGSVWFPFIISGHSGQSSFLVLIQVEGSSEILDRSNYSICLHTQLPWSYQVL